MRLLFFTLLLFLLAACRNREDAVDKNKLLGNDYRLFQGTPAWQLAKAVWDEDVEEIKTIVGKGEIAVDYPEPRFGQSLLMLAVMNEQYEACKALLELRADPNRHDRLHGTSPMIQAAGITSDPLGDNTRFLKLLLKHGGNPNDEEVGERIKGNTLRNTPLLNSIGHAYGINSPIEKVKLLVEAGANVNYNNEFGSTPLGMAMTFDHYDVVLYLLQKGADYKSVTSVVEGKEYYLWDELRFQLWPLESDEYKRKMQVVEFLKKKGIDYREVPIPEYAVKEAKKKYPDSWQEYLQKY